VWKVGGGVADMSPAGEGEGARGYTSATSSVIKILNSKLINCVSDPKLSITDPDPQNENQELRIQILDPDLSVN